MAKSLAGARACIFCGGTPVTREHVLPNWLAAAIREVSESDQGYESAFELVTQDGVEKGFLYRPSSPELVVKCVCGMCNAGWMSVMETEVQPTLSALVRGQSRVLDAAAQLQLAAWACKTAMLVERLSGHVVLGPSDYQSIASEQAPPASLQVRMAHRSNAESTPFQVLLSGAASAPADPPGSDIDLEVPNTLLVTLGLGGVAIQVWGGSELTPLRSTDERRPLSIWPPTLPRIEWPPQVPSLATRGDLMVFHEEVLGTVLNPDFVRPDP